MSRWKPPIWFPFPYRHSMPNPSFVEIKDLPTCCPGTSSATVLAYPGTVRLMYETRDSPWPDSDSWAVIRFHDCGPYHGGGPNDEAAHNHRLYKHGLLVYSIQEVLNSPWLREQNAINHKDGNPDTRLARRRHFILALKETLFECAANGYSLVGEFNSSEAAYRALCGLDEPSR